jgi:hypothetical protein
MIRLFSWRLRTGHIYWLDSEASPVRWRLDQSSGSAPSSSASPAVDTIDVEGRTTVRQEMLEMSQKYKKRIALFQSENQSVRDWMARVAHTLHIPPPLMVTICQIEEDDGEDDDTNFIVHPPDSYSPLLGPRDPPPPPFAPIPPAIAT